MRLAALLLGVWLLPATGSAAERRCGWYENPTPANLLLRDKQGEWWITSMGEAVGPNAEGWEDKAPSIDHKQYVEVQPNGYGYGCACLTVETKRGKPDRITRIISGETRPLSQCRRDRSLPKP